MFNTTEVNGILSGCVLGDGSLEGNQICIAHTSPQHNYVLYKEKVFNALGLSTSTRLNFMKTGSLGTHMYSRVSVWTNNPELNGAGYADLIDMLTPHGLLIWWLDDGSLSVHHKNNGQSVSRFGYLSTQRFTYEQNIHIGELLNNRFGIESRVHKDTGSGFDKNASYYRLYFNATNMRRIIDIIRPFIKSIPNNMKYKFNMQYIETRTLASKEYVMWYNF